LKNHSPSTQLSFVFGQRRLFINGKSVDRPNLSFHKKALELFFAKKVFISVARSAFADASKDVHFFCILNPHRSVTLKLCNKTQM
jgi:hypothetical protein